MSSSASFDEISSVVGVVRGAKKQKKRESEQRGIHNWDAVGVLKRGDEREWVLIEAKAHLGEIASNCNALEHGGRPQIKRAFDEVKAALGVPLEKDWCTGYYQYASRLAALHFLIKHALPARLVFVYFVGDISGGKKLSER